MRILLIEDEPALLIHVLRGLAELGYHVDVARDEIEGRYLAVEGDYGLVLLNTALAGPDLSVLQAIRRTKRGPILMLTYRDKLADRLLGLQLGADDYLAMPFSVAALQLRVQALLEQRTWLPRTQKRIGDLVIDFQWRRCARNQTLIKLSPNEFALLAELAKSPGDVLSPSTLAKRVWTTPHEGNTLEVTIARLRRKLDAPFEVKLLHTVRGVGYVLEAREMPSSLT